MNKWTEFYTAYQVAKLGTVTAAANALGFHRATVNRHIDLLEAELGAAIFLRHARGYALTDFGSEMLQVARKTDELISDLAGHAQKNNAQIDGEITVTVMPIFTSLLFEPIIRFREQNPLCNVNISATEDLERLEYGEAHVSIRARGKPDNPDYIVQPFRSIAFNLYAHQSYIDRHGMPSTGEDMKRHQFLWLANDRGNAPFQKWIDEHVHPSQLSVTATNLTAKFDAVAAGVGLGFLTELEANAHSGLHKILPDNDQWRIPLWLVTHIDLHRTEKVQKMLACLKTP